MSIFKRLWTTIGNAERVPDTVADAGLSLPPASAAERRGRKRLDARKGARALIIDDSPTVVAVLRKILRSAGYLTFDAPDAEQGLALLRQEKPDLVFLDIILPGMNGFGALRAIRKDPLVQHIPVIMISGNEHATEQFYANRIGADDFMKKPFSRFEVFARIECLLDAERVPRRKAVVADAVPTPVEPKPASVAPQQTAPAPVSAGSEARMTALEARKALTAMGLQYFDQAQFVAAIQRVDLLAIELFIIGGGVRLDAAGGGKLPLAGDGASAVAALMQKYGVRQATRQSGSE